MDTQTLFDYLPNWVAAICTYVLRLRTYVYDISLSLAWAAGFQGVKNFCPVLFVVLPAIFADGAHGGKPDALGILIAGHRIKRVQADIEMAALLRITPSPALLRKYAEAEFTLSDKKCPGDHPPCDYRSPFRHGDGPLPAQNDSLAAIRQRPAGRQSD
jgi:hypothetical protein